MEQQAQQLIITDNSGYKVRGEVIEIGKPTTASDSIDIMLRTYDWLDFGTYDAVFITPQESLQGRYEVWSSTIESNEDIVVSGQFRRAKKSRAESRS